MAGDVGDGRFRTDDFPVENRVFFWNKNYVPSSSSATSMRGAISDDTTPAYRRSFGRLKGGQIRIRFAPFRTLFYLIRWEMGSFA